MYANWHSGLKYILWYDLCSVDIGKQMQLAVTVLKLQLSKLTIQAGCDSLSTED